MSLAALRYIGGMSNHNSSGIGLTGLLTVAFVVLKLCKVISWSWWWVLSPIWISSALIGLVLLGILVLALIQES